MNKLTIWERLTTESPKIFKQIRNFCASFAAISAALLAAEGQVPGFTLPEIAETICTYGIVAGIAAAAVSQLTVKQPVAEKP